MGQRVKHMVKTRMAAVLLVLVLLSGGVSGGFASGAAEKTVTLMVYMCGSNLESGSGAATQDLLEMAGSGYDAKKVNLLVMTGGTDFWQMGIPTDALCIYVPFRNSLRMVYAFEDMSMGSPDALSALLAYGTEKYPADEYALILWNHGGGPMNGICWDERHGADHLTMEELCAALRSGGFAERKLSWIGFDACLMASAETAFLMEPFAEYMIASEETEPAGGWNYLFLKDLEKDPDPLATAARIIDGYFDAAAGGQDALTLSCIDLSRIGALSECMDAFFDGLEVSSGNYAWFSYAARNARSFGKAVSVESSYDLMDLAELVSRLENRNPEKAEALSRALKEAVPYSRSSGTEGYGLSVYHPFFNKQEYADEWSMLYPRIGFSEGYSSYIAQFSGYLLGKTADLNWAELQGAYTGVTGLYALPLSSGQREMLSSAAMHLLRWDAEQNAYAMVGSEARQQESDNVIYIRDLRQILVAEDENGTVLTGALPYEILPDGGLAVYVNFCRGQAIGSEEADMLPEPSDNPGKKGFGSYSFDDNDTESTPLNQGLPSSSTTVHASGSDLGGASEAEVFSTSLWEETIPVVASDVSPLNKTVPVETVAVPGSLSLQESLSLTPSASAVYTPVGSEEVGIEPVQVSELVMPRPSDMILMQTGYDVSLDSFVPVDVSVFRRNQVELDLTDYDPDAARKETEPDLLHGQLILDAEEDGTLNIREIRLYEPLNGEWSARVTAQLSDYPVLSFPVSWRQPTRAGGTVAPFSRWEEVRRESYRADNTDLRLRFIPDPEGRDGTCVFFEVTDIQCAVYGSLPIFANP